MLTLKNAALVASMVLSGGLMFTVPAQADGDADNGAKIFRRCQACHTVEADKNRVGPSLHNIMGREAGTLESFKRYSPAMKASDIVWNDETLHAYLENPRDYIPKNSMAFPGLRKESDRDDVIAFLERASKD